MSETPHPTAAERWIAPPSLKELAPTPADWAWWRETRRAGLWRDLRDSIGGSLGMILFLPMLGEQLSIELLRSPLIAGSVTSLFAWWGWHWRDRWRFSRRLHARRLRDELLAGAREPRPGPPEPLPAVRTEPLPRP